MLHSARGSISPSVSTCAWPAEGNRGAELNIGGRCIDAKPEQCVAKRMSVAPVTDTHAKGNGYDCDVGALLAAWDIIAGYLAL